MAAVLQAAIDTLEARIIEREGDLLSFVFFGTNQKQNSNDFDNIVVFSPLDRPDAQTIGRFESMLKAVKAGERLSFGVSEKCSISDALWTW